jgi:hypothetical protein
MSIQDEVAETVYFKIGDNNSFTGKILFSEDQNYLKRLITKE